MSAYQKINGSVSLCLTGGSLANEVYDNMALQAASSELNAQQVHLWWNWDSYVALDNPDRNSLQALSRLGGALSLDPSKIHPIPSSTGSSDSEAGAAQYDQELQEHAPIDICLLELHPTGRVAGLFPDHHSGPSGAFVSGVTSAANSDSELVTITRKGLSMCHEIWILAQGEDVADLMSEAFDPELTSPASYVSNSTTLLWLADSAATSLLPFHHCLL